MVIIINHHNNNNTYCRHRIFKNHSNRFHKNIFLLGCPYLPGIAYLVGKIPHIVEYNSLNLMPDLNQCSLS